MMESIGSEGLGLAGAPSFVAIVAAISKVVATGGIAATADVTSAAGCARGTGHR